MIFIKSCPSVSSLIPNSLLEICLFPFRRIKLRISLSIPLRWTRSENGRFCTREQFQEPAGHQDWGPSTWSRWKAVLRSSQYMSLHDLRKSDF